MSKKALLVNSGIDPQPPSIECVYTYTVGWSDFLKNKNDPHSMLCQIVVGPPKFRVSMLLLSLVAGPQKIWIVTLKSGQI